MFKSPASLKTILVTLISIVLSNYVSAKEQFTAGPLIETFGAHIAVVQDTAVKPNAKFKVAFDVGGQSGQGKLNRSFDSLARFLNMHVASGVPADNIKLALVVHGKAAFDTLRNAAYEDRFLEDNPNKELLSQLMKNNVDIYVCGQTAGFLSIKNEELQKGIMMSLSAMTAHAQLQQAGYSLNPF